MNNNIFQILQNAAEFSISYFSPIVSQNFVGVTGHSRSMPEVNEEKNENNIEKQMTLCTRPKRAHSRGAGGFRAFDPIKARSKK